MEAAAGLIFLTCLLSSFHFLSLNTEAQAM